VQVEVVHEKVGGSAQAKLLPLLPGVTLRSATREQIERVQISNARPEPIQMELRRGAVRWRSSDPGRSSVGLEKRPADVYFDRTG
jgi:hypothetical protein